MKKSLIIFLLLTGFVTTAQNNSTIRGINVTGEGTVRVAPDQVLIKSRIEHEGDSAGEVKKMNDSAVDAVLKYLEREGVNEKYIKTDYIKLNKRYNYNDKTYTYSANQAISIHLKDLEDYERIMSGLLEHGLNRIDGVQFKSSEAEKHKKEARRKAVLDAKQKANELAEPLGQKVGKAFSINELSENGYQPVYRMAEMKMSDSAEEEQSIAPGEMEITIKVTIGFELD